MSTPNLFTAQRKRLVVIDGDETLILNAFVERVTSTQEVVDRIQETGQVTTPILPSGCRLYSSTESGRKIYVVERPPVQINAHFQSIFNHIEGKEFSIWIPWQIYVIEVNREGLYQRHKWLWSRTRIMSRNTEVFHTALPNEYVDGTSCMGTGTNLVSAGSDIEKISQLIIGHYRNSAYNSDLDGQLSQMEPTTITNHEPPEEFNGVTWESMNETRCTRYIYKLAHWCSQQLNPQIDICNLDYLSRGNFGRFFDAFKEGNI